MRKSTWSVSGLALAAMLASGPLQAGETKRISALFFEGCEKTCEGFKAGMAASKFPVEIAIIDVNQDKAKIPDAVKQMESQKPDLVLLYGTSATVTALGTLDKAQDKTFMNSVPVVFTAVADPVGSKIVKSLEQSGRANVTGTFNRVPEKLNIQAIRRLDPGFAKIGLLYHANEQNSVAKLKEITELGKTEGFAVIGEELKSDGKNPPELSEIERGLTALKQQGVSWLYVGSSSFLNANGALFTETATKLGIAVVSPYPALVTEKSALMSIAAPREEVGALAAQQALKVLRDGAKPGDLPIEKSQHFTYTLNLGVAKQLGMTIPNAPEGTPLMVQEFFLSAP